MDTRKHLRECRARIKALPLNATPEQVIAAVAPLPAHLFPSIDDEIGNCVRHFEYGGRGPLVRAVRNHPIHGPKLYAALGQKRNADDSSHGADYATMPNGERC